MSGMTQRYNADDSDGELSIISFHCRQASSIKSVDLQQPHTCTDSSAHGWHSTSLHSPVSLQLDYRQLPDGMLGSGLDRLQLRTGSSPGLYCSPIPFSSAI